MDSPSPAHATKLPLPSRLQEWACAGVSGSLFTSVLSGRDVALRNIRQVLMACAAGLSMAVPHVAQAGAQVEEPLADSVRSALSAAIGRSEPALVFADEAQRQRCENWAQSLEPKLLKSKPEELVRREFLHTVCYEAKRAGLEPSLVLGLIQVESGFRKYAISSVGARGYMQIMPFWSRTIGNGEASSLFHMQTNLRFGCVILRHYLDLERGNLFMALGRYNGSRGRPEYPNAVTAAWRTWQLADIVLTRQGTRLAEAEPSQRR